MRKRIIIHTSTTLSNRSSLRNLFLSFSITLFIFSSLLVFNSLGIQENLHARGDKKIELEKLDQSDMITVTMSDQK